MFGAGMNPGMFDRKTEDFMMRGHGIEPLMYEERFQEFIEDPDVRDFLEKAPQKELKTFLGKLCDFIEDQVEERLKQEQEDWDKKETQHMLELLQEKGEKILKDKKIEELRMQIDLMQELSEGGDDDRKPKKGNGVAKRPAKRKT